MGQYGYDHFGTPKPKNLNPVSHPDDIAVKISGKENLLISGASDGLMLKFLPERGRFYVATRQIQPGEPCSEFYFYKSNDLHLSGLSAVSLRIFPPNLVKKLSSYPLITYYWTGLLTLDHSYLVGNLTNSEIAETKVLEPLKS